MEHAVYERDGLCAGDVLIRQERSVLIALDPAVVGGLVDGDLGPVTVDVREAEARVVSLLVEARGDGRKLGAGDIGVGIELAVRVAVHYSERGEGGHGAAVPVALIHIGKAVLSGEAAVAGIVLEQTEEDGGDLGAGDVPLGMHVAVGVADYIREVVGEVEQRRIVARDRRSAGAGAGRNDLLRDEHPLYLGEGILIVVGHIEIDRQLDIKIRGVSGRKLAEPYGVSSRRGVADKALAVVVGLAQFILINFISRCFKAQRGEHTVPQLVQP